MSLGAIVIRFAHPVTDKSNLPLFARRLIAELSRSDKPVSVDSSLHTTSTTAAAIAVKNKYFDAQIYCVLADDNRIVVVDSTSQGGKQDHEHQQQQQQQNNQSDRLSTQQLLCTLRSARIPFGLVQLADLGAGGNNAFNSSLDLMSDTDCSRAVAAPLQHGTASAGDGGGATPLFNVCLALTMKDATSEQATTNNNTSRQQQLLQNLREKCVARGIECVPWNIDTSAPLNQPVPPAPGVEKRGLLAQQGGGELTGSARVLEVTNQSLWCGDALRATTATTKSQHLPPNMFGLFSSSRFTCEFGCELLSRTKNIETHLVTTAEDEQHQPHNKAKQQQQQAKPLFFGSPDGQRFTARVRSRYQPLSGDIECYFSPLDLICCPRTAALGAAELRRLLNDCVPQCRVVMFHLMVGGDGIARTEEEDTRHRCCWWANPTTASDVARVLDTIGAALNAAANTSTQQLPLPLRDDLACVLVIEDRSSNNSGNAGINEKTLADPIANLTRLGCETVFVPSNDECNNFDKEAGAQGLLRIEEIFQCARWAAPAVKQRLLDGSKNNVALVVNLGASINTDHAATTTSMTTAMSETATIIARSFSNDNDETAVAHEKKTDWIRAEELALLPQSIAQHNTCVYTTEIDTKYYSAPIDVVAVSCGGAANNNSNGQQHQGIIDLVGALISASRPTALVLLVPPEHAAVATTLVVKLCDVALDEEGDDHEDDDGEPKQQEENEDESKKLLLGPNSNRIAVVSLSDSAAATNISSDISKLREVCGERFVDVLPHQHEEDEEQQSSGKLTRTAALFDALCCVDWPKRNEKRAPPPTNTAALESLLNVDAAVARETPAATTATAEAAKSSTSASASVVAIGCELPPNYWIDPKTKRSVPRTTPQGESSNNDAKGSNNTGGTNDDDDDNEDDGMADLLNEMRDVRDNKRLSWEERQKRAAELSERFAKRLHQSDELADAICKNIL